MESLELLNLALKNISISKISDNLNVSPSTVKRWIELNNVPHNYIFDLMKLNNIKIDYTKFTSKQKDQFYTTKETAKYCFDVFKNKLYEMGLTDDKYTYIEPSAGDGSFMKVLPSKRTIGMDIEPRGENIIKYDFLDWEPSEEKDYVVFGNPPFGLRGHTALKFILHSYNFADFVCFILPQLFESDGKGVPRKRIKNYNLLHSEKLNTTFYEPVSIDKSNSKSKTTNANKNIKINVVFQIWSKNFYNEKYVIKDDKNSSLKVFSLSDGGTPSTTRNKKMLNLCDIYLPSTCFGKENMRCYDTFSDLPGKKGYGLIFKNKKDIDKAKNIKWHDISFLSTNSAYNLRTNIIKSQFI